MSVSCCTAWLTAVQRLRARSFVVRIRLELSMVHAHASRLALAYPSFGFQNYLLKCYTQAV